MNKPVFVDNYGEHGISGTGVDKKELYGEFQDVQDLEKEHLKERYKLSNKIAQKAADIGLLPDEDMNLNINRGVQGSDLAKMVESMNQGQPPPQPQRPSSSGGFGWKELAIVCGTMLGGSGLYVLNNNLSQKAPTVPAGTTDSAYDVLFYDKDGNLIDVQPLPSSSS